LQAGGQGFESPLLHSGAARIQTGEWRLYKRSHPPKSAPESDPKKSRGDRLTGAGDAHSILFATDATARPQRTCGSIRAGNPAGQAGAVRPAARVAKSYRMRIFDNLVGTKLHQRSDAGALFSIPPGQPGGGRGRGSGQDQRHKTRALEEKGNIVYPTRFPAGRE
jgi:hypothetical protein